MAPKRSTKTVVETTKQVVTETVQVSSVVQSKRQKKQSEDSGDQTREPVKTINTISIETQDESQTQNVEISEPLKTRRIPIQTEEENQILKGQNAEAKTTLTSDQKEAEEEEEEGEKKEDQEDTVETNTTSDEKEDEQKSEEVKIQEGEKEDSMETNTTSDEREEETTKKEERKSDEVKTQKGGKKSSEKKRKRRERGGGEEYKIYVHRVLKQVHPGMGVSSKGMTVLNNLMNDMFERLADEAARLTTYTARKTLSSREIQGAVKLVLPGELGRHAMAEGTKAVSTYVSNNNGRQSKS
ncbi:unnamed protein product [Prunus armeniaca]|uniref:Core Histone H2A/H2B/H3 domain-containing protein n=1 Tax=Prunus armeniaca TaxID=36596 RepID=A0A6J5XHW7_PRUAR|nr:hypothetical protein GBA52_020856 [Prunus armeniaca]CAB4313299.1 unnamed protein product [Prunus armeniaca]